METAKNYYNKQYESWMPWIEDKYLAWWGQNKTSYVAKGTLHTLSLPTPQVSLMAVGEMDKTKITGDKNIDAIQDGINQGVSGQFAKGGVLEGVGNLGSKEVFTRSERGGKNESGQHDL